MCRRRSGGFEEVTSDNPPKRFFGPDRPFVFRYFVYYNPYLVHQSLEMDAPERRKTQVLEDGNVAAIPEVGGLQYRYERTAA